MKLIDSNVELLPQESGVIGMFKFIERVGRTAYMSLDKITEDSYKKFNSMLYNKGHWAVFNLATVYLKVPVKDFFKISELLENPWTKWTESKEFYYITTNYRVICQLELDEVMENYWSGPIPGHHHIRSCAKFTCSRVIAQQILRHRVLCPIMESTRYVNYSKGRFGSEITYIIPSWIYKLRDKLSETIDPVTKKERTYLKDLNGVDLWNELCRIDKTVKRRDKFLKLAEEEYMYETTTEEGEKLPAEDARGVLPLDTKTELCITGYLEDWYYESPETSPEKAGFFKLRCASDAQSDVRYLANKLKNIFEEEGLDKLLINEK